MNQPPFQIERLAPGDETRLRTIRLRALQHDPDAFDPMFEEANLWTRDQWREQLEKLATFVAAKDKTDVGLVRGAPHTEFPDTGYLISLWVAPEARRQGIAQALIETVVQWARAQGYRRLVLDVAGQNQAASALYAKQGFRPNGVTDTLPPPRTHIPEIQLERVLSLAR